MEYYRPYKREVRLYGNSSPYARYHELAHSIQHRRHRWIHYIAGFAFVFNEVLMWDVYFPRIGRFFSLFTYLHEADAARIAGVMMRYIGKWDDKSQKEAIFALGTYVNHPEQAKLFRCWVAKNTTKRITWITRIDEDYRIKISEISVV